ncbi:hypothetical protein P3342_002822 [Pyrenophora teres f. teres]|uniref:PH domain-like protein n=2 Tax=Pyrenophora teres f. teres TaxID=97479 RepID=E3RWW6_PYRTT|nr:hypothetical protein PTT_13820 [Pyrenophora teres f. teres 0-1]KAE8842118.1 hypothetical protein HRS9139_01415 [Pyrenophora teres f. teres]KAE8850811.1 hypothetical protein PTNB85_01227 [Pyrenophora teres f. teres]KAE8851156.1 hypothetical protein HRS9122_01443 [Pyrenophora teres f. teres]KAE8869829.1 hypothetical protein PTNB29_00173 [Pyrenophora teres f. teres]
MPPPRKSRASQPQPPPQPSDYETDAPPAVDVPLPPRRSNEELNLSVLGRIYPDVRAIEHVTPYAALYTFSLETQQWEKMGIEGTLFICQLTPSPMGAERYCAIILNRRGLDNFYEELTSSDKMEISDPYVIIQGEHVYGIWIFADPPPASTANCRVETAAKMMDIADRAKASRDALEPPASSTMSRPTEAALSTPMGRQLSLRDLFGHQREQDADFSIHNHTAHPMPSSHYPPQAYLSNPAPPQSDLLGQLFSKAKQNHNRLA